jgi:hypothetical protein
MTEAERRLYARRERRTRSRDAGRQAVGAAMAG